MYPPHFVTGVSGPWSTQEFTTPGENMSSGVEDGQYFFCHCPLNDASEWHRRGPVDGPGEQAQCRPRWAREDLAMVLTLALTKTTIR